MASPIYLDSNALIQAVEAPERTLFDILERLSHKGLELVTSDLSLAEVLCKPMQDGAEALVVIYDRMIADKGLIRPIPVDRSILRKSAEVRVSFGGKLPDAIHVATAISAACNVIVSSDKRLRLPKSLQRIAAEDAGILEALR